MEDIQPTDARVSYTILRIKRKRNEEPLDALGELLLHKRRMSRVLMPSVPL